jgi:hypothetical protein
MTSQHCLAQKYLSMTICEGWKRWRRTKIACFDIAIEGPEELLESIRKSFTVTTGVAADMPPRWIHQ